MIFLCLFIHMFLGKIKTNDFTQRIIPMTDFAFTSAVKNIAFAPKRKEQSA